MLLLKDFLDAVGRDCVLPTGLVERVWGKLRNNGLGDLEKSFLLNWAAIRKQGKAKFILTRGSLLGFLIFNFWLIVTIVEIFMLSDLELAQYSWESFIKKCLLWFTLEIMLGFALAVGSWKANEEKYHHYVLGHLSMLEILELSMRNGNV